MCEPVSIAIAVATVAATIAQQQQAANAENDYEELVYGQRKAQAFETFAALREREYQEREKASQDIRRVTSQARQAASAAKLQAIEGGTGGASVDALYAQFERGELMGIGQVQSNLAATSGQLRREARAAGMIQGPRTVFGPLDTPIGIASSVLQAGNAAYGAHQTASAAKAPPAV